MSGRNSIQVAIKVRPLLKKDKDQQLFWRVVDNSIQLLESQSEPCYFDHIFNQDANNHFIFDKMAKQIVHSAIQGFNGTIFAYGQTSSGKTYTMMGDDDNPGVMVFAAKEIFKEIERTQDRQFLLRVGYIEIYNEKIYDLLNKKNQDLKIHETSTGIVSVNCEEIIIRSEDDLLFHLDKGGKERTVGETNMNERSSRSHAIFRIIIESRKVNRTEDDAVIQSVINLVDLAGSERADQTGARGARLKEGGHINKSLLFLSNVIKRLSENEDDKYISFRDSKLTRILQASLGGNALTAIICTIKPNAIEETQSTISFALRAKAIKNKPQVNEIISDATMMKRLEHEIKVLKTRLEEEQRKNESQIKVRQLEQRIKDEDLKIISYNSLHSTRNIEKRRRTWCPSSTGTGTIGQIPSSLPVPSLSSLQSSGIMQSSRLQVPKASINTTSLITFRQSSDASSPAARTTIGGLPVPPDNMPEIDEEFAPAEMVNFEQLSPNETSCNIDFQRNISITPKLFGCAKSTLEKVEKDLQELQSFTNLENKVDVQHEPILTLSYRVETLSQRNAELERERLDYLQVKNELELKTECLREAQHKIDHLSQRNNELQGDISDLQPFINDHENLIESQKKCGQLQEQLRQLIDLHNTSNEKIIKYEAELAELRKTNEKLEMENREAVNLEFEIKRHKTKSKLRENELIEALNEKEKDIAKLEKSLNSLSAERFQNSKEKLLKKSLYEDGVADDDGKVCIKCEDLHRLIEENRKVSLEFEKLTLEYENLKFNYDEIGKENEANKLEIVRIEKQQEKDKGESEKLLIEVQKLKEQLYNVQQDYELLSSESSLKQEECLELTRQIEAAKQEMVVLEEKFTKLELSWQEQQQTIIDIEAQYATIQTKYAQLQSQYEELEASRGQSLTDYHRLEKENFDLQAEIEDLKKKVHDAQQRLLENNINNEASAKATKSSNEEYPLKLSKIQEENEESEKQLEEIQIQFKDLQKEYDDLSNQLMDNLQDCEILKNDNIKLKEKLEDFENKNDCAESEISELKLQLETIFSRNRPPCHIPSMRSPGICIEEKKDNFIESRESKEFIKKFSELFESLTELELEHTKGKTKLFQSASKNSTPAKYKMYIKNISGVDKSQKEFDMKIENLLLQGVFKQHSFHIVELSNSGEDNFCDLESSKVDINGCENITEYVEKLKQEIVELKAINEHEHLGNKSILENTERALHEMREQITQLSAELLEKSIFVENCACKIYQQQIENLQKEKADITLIYEELQEKTNSILNESLQITNISHSVELKALVDDNINQIKQLKPSEQELFKSCGSQTKTVEEITQRCMDMETELKISRDQLIKQEQLFKETYNQLKLENLQKLELSANEYRDNMKKYNKEWEEKKDEYEQIIKDFQNQINDPGQIANKVEEVKMEIKQETVPKHINNIELENIIEASKQDESGLQEESLSLQQQLITTEEHLREENRTQCEEITLLDSKLVQLEELLSDAKAVNVTLSRENSSLKTKIDDIRQDLSCIPVLHDKNQQLSDEMDVLNSKYLKLKAELEKPDVQKQKFLKDNTNCRDFSPKDKKKRKDEKNKLSSNDLEHLNLENKQLYDKLQTAEKLIEEQRKNGGSQELVQTLQAKLEFLTSLMEEKHTLTNDCKNLRKEYKQVNAKLVNSEQQLEELQKENVNREDLLKTLENNLNCFTSLEQQKIKLGNEYENLQQDYKQEQEKLLKTEQQIERLQKETTNREELLKTLQNKFDQVQEMEKAKTILVNDYQNLQQQYNEVQDKLFETEQQIEKIQNEDAKREEMVKTIEIKLNCFKSLEEQKNKLGNEYEELQLNYKHEQEKLLKTEQQIERLQKETTNREELLQTLQNKFDQVQEMEKAKTILANDYQNLQHQYKEVQDKLFETEQQIEQIQNEEANREKLLETMQNKLEGLTLLEEQNNILANDYEILQQEYKQVREKLLKTEQQLEELQKEDANREEMLKTIEIKLNCLTSFEEEKIKLRNEYENLQQDYKHEQEKLLKTEQQIEQIQNEEANREKLLETMQKKLEGLTPLEEQKNILANDLEILQQEYKQVREKLLKTEQQLEELQKEDANRKEILKVLKTKHDHLASVEDEKNTLASDYENLQQEHNQAQDTLLKTRQQIQELCSEDVSRETAIQSLQNELCNMKAIEEEKKPPLDREYSEPEVEKLCNTQSDLEGAKTKLQLEKVELENKLEQVTTEKNMLENETRKLSLDFKSVSEKHSSLLEENIILVEQLKCLKEKENGNELLLQTIKEKSELIHSAQNRSEENEKCMQHDKEEKNNVKQLQTVNKSFTTTIEQKKRQQQEPKDTTKENDLQTSREKLNIEIRNKLEQEQKLEVRKHVFATLQQEIPETKYSLDKSKQDQANLNKEITILKESNSKALEKKLQELKNLENNYQKAQNVNQALQLQLKDLNDNLNKFKNDQEIIINENTLLQAELQSSKDCLAKLQKEQHNFEDKLKHYQNLQEDKNKLEATLNVLKNAQTGTVISLKNERDELLKNLEQYVQQNKDFKEKEETLKQKIDSLSQQLHDMRIKSNSYERLLLEHEELEIALTSMKSNNQQLQQEISQLNAQQQSKVSKIEKLSIEIDEQNSQLQKQNEEKEVLEEKLSHLKNTLQRDKCTLQKENGELKSSFEELTFKFSSLQSTNTQLDTLNQELQQQLISVKEKLIKSYGIQEKSKRLEIQHSELQLSLKQMVEKAERSSQDLDRHKVLLEKQLERYNALKLEMENKQQYLSKENLQLTAIIKVLTTEKNMLQENLRQISLKNFEHNLQRDANEVFVANMSSDSNSSKSPKGRRSLDERLSNTSIEEKLIAKQKKISTTVERKNRRSSVHDERRRQSYWGAVHDEATMTDPVDTSCNCIELDCKLKECERNLFIKNSQVTALSMELKNHPLKDENAGLKKRLKEEQEKCHTEIKRLKIKLSEQTIKTDKALVAHLTAKSSHAELLGEQKTPDLKVLSDIETQTDGDINESIHILQTKYNDAKNICRHRYNVIKDLEEQLKLKNSDGTSVSDIENKTESMKQELAAIKKKYDLAKKVLYSRRQEIQNLRSQLEQNP